MTASAAFFPLKSNPNWISLLDLNDQVPKLPEQFRVKTQEHTQHAAKIHFGDIFLLERADELVQIIISQLHEELLKFIAAV